jgi:hypothetical protein
VSTVNWSFGDDLEAEIEKAAKIVTRRYSGVVSFDDLLQEARMWAALHAAIIAEHRADPNKGTSYSGWAMRQALVKLCEKEREHLTRYASTDPSTLPLYGASESERELALHVAHEWADDPGPKGEAAREYLVHVAEEHELADDLAEGRKLTEAERATAGRCLASGVPPRAGLSALRRAHRDVEETTRHMVLRYMPRPCSTSARAHRPTLKPRQSASPREQGASQGLLFSSGQQPSP